MNEETRDLIALMRDHKARLEKIRDLVESALENEIELLGKTSVSALFELLKFRHFKQYYFDLEYDWDRLDFLLIKIRKVHPMVEQDLDRFVQLLEAI